MAAIMPSGLKEKHDYAVYKNVRIPMRDGVELSADIFFPAKNGLVDFSKKYPVAMNRTCYMDNDNAMSPTYFEYFLCERGYAVIMNAARGTYLSDGEFQPVANEGWGTKTDGYGDKTDGLDTLAWIIKQPWSSGQVVMCGKSYLGATQYALLLSGDTSGYVTSVVDCPAMNSIDGGWVYSQEFLDAGCTVFWALARAFEPGVVSHMPEEAQKGIAADLEALGLKEHPELLTPVLAEKLQREYSCRDIPVVRHMPFYQKWLDHRDDPEFFAYNDTRTRKHDIDKPVLFQAGWFDLFGMNSINGYKKMVEDAPTEEIARAHRLIIGPWGHIYTPLVRRFPEAETDDRLFCMEWFEQQVHGIKSSYFEENPVSMFVLGENRWRSEKTWPLSDAVPVKYYIHSNGMANTMMGTGTLSAVKPEKEEADHYFYDPANPVAATGGVCVYDGGQRDQRLVEMRPDVLVYTSEVLEEDVEVTGYIKGKLFASTSAKDTDFFMKLLDVCPDGNVYNVVTGGRRGRYLKEGRSNPQPLTPGEIYEYDIELRATSCVFKKGHQIRVEITSSDCLLSDVNPNDFIDLNTCTSKDYVTAQQTVYHDAAHMSYIELPVVPASHERKWIEWPFGAKETGVCSPIAFVMNEKEKIPELDAADLPTA